MIRLGLGYLVMFACLFVEGKTNKDIFEYIYILYIQTLPRRFMDVHSLKYIVFCAVHEGHGRS